MKFGYCGIITNSIIAAKNTGEVYVRKQNHKRKSIT